LVVEADAPTRFVRGVQGLVIRLARAINRALHRRGPVWHGRYHAHILENPREVRNALVYVLNNIRKHLPGAVGLDPCSSARWFDGWQGIIAASAAVVLVASARTWLGSIGWRRHGLIDVAEAPRLLMDRQRPTRALESARRPQRPFAAQARNP